jgi:hypothetical protein
MQTEPKFTQQSIVDAAVRWPRPTFDQRIADFVRSHFGTLITNSERVATGTLAASFQAQAITHYFPGLGTRHCLCLAEPFGFNLHEPQASTGIAHFCQAQYDPDLAANRCKAAVRALLPNELSSSSFMSSLKSAHSFRVAAEECIDNSYKRMDWVICWQDDSDHRYRVVVEMKFGHTVTDRQLEDYGRDAIDKVDGPERLRLVLLSLDGAFSKVDRRSLKEIWHPLSWLNFLRRWEGELISDHDSTFITFRRQLWARIGA